MQAILLNNNLDLKREVLVIIEGVENTEIPSVLNPFKEWLLDTLKYFEEKINENLYYLNLENTGILPEILSNTQSLTINIRALIEQYSSPILRYSQKDLFPLLVIDWLHKQHDQSKKNAFAISDGNFAIFPTVDSPIIYFLPSSSLTSIVHLPLIFHEFGHYLYSYHKLDMDNLVKDLQKHINELSAPSYRRNDIKHKNNAERLNKIVETWYEWTQELFCDAVGLYTTGEVYLKTFSLYLRMMGRGQFILEEENLIHSSHPVSWLRIRLLVKRAEKYGLKDAVSVIEAEWEKIAGLLNLSEDYYGFYDPSFDAEIERTIDDMLTEASPIYFEDYLSVDAGDNIIKLISTAWEKYSKDHENYDEWERTIIQSYFS